MKKKLKAKPRPKKKQVKKIAAAITHARSPTNKATASELKQCEFLGKTNGKTWGK